MTAAEPGPSGGPCPCGKPLGYDACCGRFHRGEAVAPTAEALMRSRYAAFARRDVDYLAQTWHPSTRPRTIHDDPTRVWTGLEIVATTGGGMLDAEGTVEFFAHHRTPETGDDVLHEVSTFTRVDGRWVYVTRID